MIYVHEIYWSATQGISKWFTYCCADVQAEADPFDVNGVLIAWARVGILTKIISG